MASTGWAWPPGSVRGFIELRGSRWCGRPCSCRGRPRLIYSATLEWTGGFFHSPGTTPRGTEVKLKSPTVMKAILRPTCAAALVSLLLSVPLHADDPPPGLVNFGKFTKPTNGELVEINLNGDMLAMALQLAGKSQPDMTEALAGLHS